MSDRMRRRCCHCQRLHIPFPSCCMFIQSPGHYVCAVTTICNSKQLHVCSVTLCSIIVKYKVLSSRPGHFFCQSAIISVELLSKPYVHAYLNKLLGNLGWSCKTYSTNVPHLKLWIWQCIEAISNNLLQHVMASLPGYEVGMDIT
jgi:hypothetical protein